MPTVWSARSVTSVHSGLHSRPIFLASLGPNTGCPRRLQSKNNDPTIGKTTFRTLLLRPRLSLIDLPVPSTIEEQELVDRYDLRSYGLGRTLCQIYFLDVDHGCMPCLSIRGMGVMTHRTVVVSPDTLNCRIAAIFSLSPREISKPPSEGRPMVRSSTLHQPLINHHRSTQSRCRLILSSSLCLRQQLKT